MNRLQKSLLITGATVVGVGALYNYLKGEEYKIPDYSCTGTGRIIGQISLSDNVFRTWEDYDGDGIPDAQITYFVDREANCLRKIRVVDPYVEESKRQGLERDVQAYKNFRKRKVL